MQTLTLFWGTIVLSMAVVLSCQLETGTAPDAPVNESPFTRVAKVMAQDFNGRVFLVSKNPSSPELLSAWNDPDTGMKAFITKGNREGVSITVDENFWTTRIPYNPTLSPDETNKRALEMYGKYKNFRISISGTQSPVDHTGRFRSAGLIADSDKNFEIKFVLSENGQDRMYAPEFPMAILPADDGSVIIEIRIGLLRGCCSVSLPQKGAGKAAHAYSCMDYNGWNWRGQQNPNPSCTQGNTGHYYFFGSDCSKSLLSNPAFCITDFDHVSFGLDLEPWCDGAPSHMCSISPVGHSSAPHCHGC